MALPAEWEGRIFRRAEPTAVSPRRPGTPPRTAAARTGWPGEQTQPVVHLANFALPAQRGDYGSGAVEIDGRG